MAVININRNQFEEMVHSGKTVLVEFSAPWCVYCRRLAPALESVAEEYKDTLVFTAVNIDDEPELAEAEAIEVVPLVPKGIFRFRFSENSFVIFELSIEHKSQTNNYSR